MSCDAISAQAAIDQAHYAGASFWTGVAQAIVAFLTLLAAVGAALFAKAAASYTGRGVAEAKRSVQVAEETLNQARATAHSDQRAWLGVKLSLLNASRSVTAAHFDLEATIRNVGNTPALRVGIDVHVYVENSIQTGDGKSPRLGGYRHPVSAILPGDSTVQRVGERLDNDFIKNGMESARRGGCAPIVFVDAVVSYHTMFDGTDDPLRLSTVRFIVVPAISDPSAHIARFRWLEDGPHGSDSVIFRQQQRAPSFVT